MDPLATSDELAAYSKGQISTTDPRADDALSGASTAIRRYCGWHITPSLEATVKLDGPGGRVLSLPTLYITDLGSITELGETLTDEQDFRWSEDGSVKKTGWSCWTDEYRAIDVTFTHGYGEAPDVKQIVLAAVARGLSSPSGATREQAGALSATWATVAPGVSGGLALLQHELAILDTYRIKSV